MSVEDALTDGVAYIRWKLDLARAALSLGKIVDVDDALLEALDVVTGHCQPKLRVAPAPPRTEAIHAFLLHDEDGTEGVAVYYAQPEGVLMPMIATDPARTCVLREIAQDIATERGAEMQHVRFNGREDLEVIRP